MPKIIHDWKSVLTGAWSVQVVIASLICIAAYAFASPAIEAWLGWPPKVFLIASVVLQALAPVARILVQTQMNNLMTRMLESALAFRKDQSGAMRLPTGRTAVAAAVIALVTPFLIQWEGVELKAYRDIVGKPTICMGETKGVKMGDTATKAECLEMLGPRIAEFYAEIERCMTNKDIPVGVQASMLELAYNVGATPVCRSTMMRRANAGSYRAACDELRKWVIAGGNRVRGLENRRADSKYRLCLQGLT